jgi:alanine-glyoxylate transaminase/serine-glyoxylate transaminase/serine-pyruvate transaminase
VSFSPRAVERIRSRTHAVQSWFLDLNLVMGYWGSADTTPKRAYHHTAPINALYGLHESLVMLAEEGLAASWARHQRMHEALAAGLEAMGLEFIVAAPWRLPQLNAVRVPVGVDEAAVRQRLLAEFDLEIGGGLGALAGKAWRIGLMGYAARPENVRLCLEALGTALAGAEGIDAAAGLPAAQALLGRAAA